MPYAVDANVLFRRACPAAPDIYQHLGRHAAGDGCWLFSSARGSAFVFGLWLALRTDASARILDPLHQAANSMPRVILSAPISGMWLGLAIWKQGRARGDAGGSHPCSSTVATRA